MREFLKKSAYTGLGLGWMAKERVEELARSFARDAELSEEQGRKLVSDMLEHSEQSKEELDSKLEKKIREVMDRLGLAEKKEVDLLKEQVAALENRLAALEGAAEKD